MESIEKIKDSVVTKTTPDIDQKLIISELKMVSNDRTRKDIADLKNALLSAESVWYPNRSRLFNLYEDVTLDGHLSGVIMKRIDAVLNKTINFQKEGKKVDDMDDLIDSEEFRQVIRKIIETKLWGLTGLEFIPGDKFGFVEIPRRHIKPEFKIIALEQSGLDGIDYKGITNLWIMGDDKDLGLLLKCSFYALWKRGSMADWAQYIEIFGQPVRIIYYDAYDTKTKLELRQVLDESGSSLAMMIPKQAQFEMMDGKQSNGDGKLQETFRLAMNEEMSVVILGNTETTTSSRSSGYAQSKEHGKQQLEITKTDMKYVRSMLNSDQFMAILKSYGYPVEGGKFEFEKDFDLEALKSRMEIDVQVSFKTPIADDYWYETYGIPKPDNYDELKAKAEAEKQAMMQPSAAPTPADPKKTDNGKGKPTQKEADKPTQMPLNKNLSVSRGLLYNLSAALADFFDPARLK